METPPAFDLKEEIENVFIVAKAAKQLEAMISERPWMRGHGADVIPECGLSEEHIQDFTIHSISRLCTRAWNDLHRIETPQSHAESE